jgi:hypothetical protein
MKLTYLRSLLAAFAAVCFLTVAAQAADPTGTWTWTMTRNGNTRTTTLKLTLKDGTLAGTVSGRGGETPISDATFQDDAVAFSVSRTYNDQTFVIKYSGKLDGDTIKGSFVMPPRDGGDPQTVDWTATRGKPADAAPAPAPN